MDGQCQRCPYSSPLRILLGIESPPLLSIVEEGGGDDKAASLTDELPGIMVVNEPGVAAIRTSCKLLFYNHVPHHTVRACDERTLFCIGCVLILQIPS